MVSLNKLVNGGLILAGQSVFSDLSSPEQAAIEQYNIIKFLSGSAPYIQHPGFGISTDIPSQCTIEQVQLFSRHGERFPSKGSGKSYEAVYKKLKAYNGTFKGELAFLNDDYTYFVPDTYWYEKETTPSNSEGYFSGTSDALKHGAAFRAKYNALYNASEVLPVFSSNSGRCYQTSNYFARGFLGDQFSDSTVKFSVISESPSSGANSLTPRSACNAWDGNANSDLIKKYDKGYLKGILKRLQLSNPGLNLSTSDIENLFGYVAYEINVRGYSPFADIFTNEEYIRYSYGNDVSYYYSQGPGYNLSKVVGSTLLNASVTLLKNSDSKNKIWLSFSHDTDWEIVHAALGLTSPEIPLPVGYVQFPDTYVHSQIVPQGARLYTEKYKCGNSSYVRYILNDAVYPIKDCSSGPGFSCEFSDFEKYIDERLNGVNFVDQCKVFNNVSHDVSFYWDYETTKYNASLIDS
ncbi:repressible acid phosphatase [[Candida] anglica]